MKRTRGLWTSIIFVGVLLVASGAGFWLGGLKPTLGLDLEGGVAAILSAPTGTPPDVMEQTLENIRHRVDAFGVGEPDIFISGTTIEVQVPGAAKSTIEERAKSQFCLRGDAGENFGCSEDRQTAQDAIGDLRVVSKPKQVCIVDAEGARYTCYGSQQEATSALGGVTVVPKSTASPSASSSPTTSVSASPSASSSGSASPSEGPVAATDTWCLTDFSNAELKCFHSRKAAEDLKKTLDTKVTKQQFCLTAAPKPQPSPSPTPSGSASASASPSASATPSPGASFAHLSGATDHLPCVPTKTAARATLSKLTPTHESSEFCVVSSAGQEQGCFLTRERAEELQRSTGASRLLDVIGQTARLEERPTLSVISPQDPQYASTPVTCATEEELASDACEFDNLTGQDVTYLDENGNKVVMGPVVIGGADIKKATARIVGGTQTQVVAEWAVEFELTGDGAKAFAAATTAAVAQSPPGQIAIVVDRVIISNPVVQGAITGGIGEITGNFSEQGAKDLATQLNAGALPVELTRQSVRTVSPTLGKESLKEGVLAGLAGLAILFLYLLFYYRLLGIVAWFGMSIWAALAVTLVSLAGSQFGYALTLAGVAGLVISLGVTADSYIVFFERLKDEVRNGRSPRTAVQPAFKRAFRTIVAADTVTGIAAAVLYVTAVSSVRGFALTLGVATILDLFVVYFFKRPTVFLIARNERLVNLHGFGLTSGVAAEETPGEVAT